MQVASGHRVFRDPPAVFQNVMHERAVQFVRVGRSDARMCRAHGYRYSRRPGVAVKFRFHRVPR